MKNLFAYVFLLFVFTIQQTFAATFPPAGDHYITACNQQVAIPNNLNQSQVIYLGCYNVAAGDFCTFRKPGSSSGYAVTAAKTLHIFAACAINTSTGTSSFFNLFYGTSDKGMNAGTPPTGVVYAFGDSAMNYGAGSVAGLNSTPIVNTTDFQVPATDFPGAINSGSSTYIQAFGYEQ